MIDLNRYKDFKGVQKQVSCYKCPIELTENEIELNIALLMTGAQA